MKEGALLYSTRGTLAIRRQLAGRGGWGRTDTCVCMAEATVIPLQETTTAVLVAVLCAKIKSFNKDRERADSQECAGLRKLEAKVVILTLSNKNTTTTDTMIL